MIGTFNPFFWWLGGLLAAPRLSFKEVLDKLALQAGQVNVENPMPQTYHLGMVSWLVVWNISYFPQ